MTKTWFKAAKLLLEIFYLLCIILFLCIINQLKTKVMKYYSKSYLSRLKKSQLIELVLFNSSFFDAHFVRCVHDASKSTLVDYCFFYLNCD